MTMYQWEGRDPDTIEALLRDRDPRTHRLWLVTAALPQSSDALVCKASLFTRRNELLAFLSRVEPLRHGLAGQPLVSLRDRLAAVVPLADMSPDHDSCQRLLNAAAAPDLAVLWLGPIEALRSAPSPAAGAIRQRVPGHPPDLPLPAAATRALVARLLPETDPLRLPRSLLPEAPPPP